MSNQGLGTQHGQTVGAFVNRQISQCCSPSLLGGWWSDDTEACFLPFLWSAKMESSATLNSMRYASDDSVLALIIAHWCCCCLFNSICVWVESILSDVTWVIFFLLGLFLPANNLPAISAHDTIIGSLFEASQKTHSLLLVYKKQQNKTKKIIIYIQSGLNQSGENPHLLLWNNFTGMEFLGSNLVMLIVGVSSGLLDPSLIWWFIY